MRARLLLISVAVLTALSCITTLATYFYYVKPSTLDAISVYKGWPLTWMTESMSFWSEPPYARYVSFQPTNFLIDFVFYAVVFQLPSQLYIYLTEVRKQKIAPRRI